MMSQSDQCGSWRRSIRMFCVMMTVTFALASIAHASECCHGAGGPLTIPVNPKATYLHTAAADSSLNAVPLDLVAMGLVPGEQIVLRRVGDFDNGPAGDTFTSLMGIFSASNILLPPANLHRVQDAIDAGMDFASAPTFFGGEPTDVPEDFLISGPAFSQICITIPDGAMHLFVAPHDSLYEDNSDPDGDYALQIELGLSANGDIDNDGDTDFDDFTSLLASWGACPGDCPADLDCDGDVDFDDFTTLLANWS